MSKAVVFAFSLYKAAAGLLLSHPNNAREAFAILKCPFVRQKVIIHINWFQFLFSIHFFIQHIKETMKGWFLSWR